MKTEKLDLNGGQPEITKPDGQFTDTRNTLGDLAVPTGRTMPSGIFDPERLRLSQDFTGDVEATKALITVPVRKPDKQTFFRCHPDVSYQLDTAVLELKEENETYLVNPSLWPELATEIVAKTLFTAINRQGVLFILSARLSGPDGRLDPWNRSLREAVEMSKKQWVKLVSNKSLGAYEVFFAKGNIPDARWPDYSFQEILEIAFKGRFICSLGHPVIRKLCGEL